MVERSVQAVRGLEFALAQIVPEPGAMVQAACVARGIPVSVRIGYAAAGPDPDQGVVHSPDAARWALTWVGPALRWAVLLVVAAQDG